MEELKLDALIDIFKKNRKLLIKIFFIVLSISAIILAFLEPQYSVDTSIIIEDKDDSMNLSPETILLGGQNQKITNEIEIIKSRKVLDNVAAELNLQYVVKRDYNFLFIYYLNMLSGKRTVQGSLNILNISGSLSGNDFDLKTTQDGYEIKFDGGIFSCEFDKNCTVADANILIQKLGDIDVGTSYSIEYKSLVKIRDHFSDSLEITPLGDSKNSNVFAVQITSSDPFKTKLILESINKKYIDTKMDWKSNDADQQQKFLEKMLLGVKKDLSEKSSELAQYQKDNQTVMPDLQFTEIMKRNVEIEKDIAILKLQEEIVNKYNDSIDIDSLDPLPAPIVIDDLSVQMTVKSHNELVGKERAMSDTLTDNHPDLIKTKTDIKQAKINLKALLKKTNDNYLKSEELLKKQSNLIFSTIENLPKNLMNIAALQRDVDVTEKLYAFLAQKFYEAGINLEMNMSLIRVLDEPTANVKKISPKLSISMLIIFILSLFVSISYLITCEFFRKQVNSVNEIVSTIKTPYITLKTKNSDEISKALKNICQLDQNYQMKKIAIYSLIPDFSMLSDITPEFLHENTIINIIKHSDLGIESKISINELSSLNSEKLNFILSDGLNQFLINKKLFDFIDKTSKKTFIVFSQIGNEIIDESFFKIFDFFIILTMKNHTVAQKLVETKTAIDNSGCKTVTTVIIDE